MPEYQVGDKVWITNGLGRSKHPIEIQEVVELRSGRHEYRVILNDNEFWFGAHVLQPLTKLEELLY